MAALEVNIFSKRHLKEVKLNNIGKSMQKKIQFSSKFTHSSVKYLPTFFN